MQELSDPFFTLRNVENVIVDQTLIDADCTDTNEIEANVAVVSSYNDKTNENLKNDDNCVVPDVYSNVKTIRNSFMNNIIICHLNINSLSSKLDEIKQLQNECKLDVMVLSETKLDESYKQEIIDIDGYSCVRQDKRSNSGGLLVYISNDIPYSFGNISICNDDIECISIELNISDEKVLLLCMYKNPRMDPVNFKKYFEETCEKICSSYENMIVIGDLNFNMLNENNMLSSIIPPFNLTNVIKEVTCFKSSQPTLIDVMLVTKRRKILKSFSENTGISDFHNLIGGVLRNHKTAPKTKKVSVRKLDQVNYDEVMSDFSEDHMTQAIASAPDVSKAYDSLQGIITTVLDKHAPKKQITIRKKDFHCMSKELKKAILYRNRLRNKYYKFRSAHYLTLYKVQRNHVTELKRKAVSSYFEAKCKTGTRNKDFWKAVKPLFSKSRTKTDSIPLREDGEIVSDDAEVCNIFNKFFRNIGSDIGFPEDNDRPCNEIIQSYQEHESIKLIKRSIRKNDSRNFVFRFVSEAEIRKVVKTLSVKKASGYDEIPAKFIKNIAPKLIRPLTLLANQCILQNTFPSNMKKANITPLHKKKDKLNKDNYRSVNLLPILSKVLERILYKQIYEHMTKLFHKYLSGFRKGYGCQDILVRMIEDWRQSLDQDEIIGVVAIDLSKAFDCMPHGLLLAKLSAYGFDNDACELMKSYTMNRQQRVKIGEQFSEWVNNIKGVPQGSILGPLLFNIFVNDFLYANFSSKIYNYADDNTLCCTDSNVDQLKNKLQMDCQLAKNWFEKNSMRANATKFQLMFLARSTDTTSHFLKVDNVEIKATDSINILGIELDKRLNFKMCIEEVCSQAGKQINALKRIRQHLEKECKKTIYNSYIKSNFNYCSPVWMFTNKVNMDKLERTNKRALRFMTNKSHLSYKEICEQEKQLNIFRNCVKMVACMMYRVSNSTAPNYISELFSRQESLYDMRDSNKFVLPRFYTIQYGKNSLSYYGVKLWNNIPLTIKNSHSLNTFKRSINKWLLTCDDNKIM